MKLLLGHLLSEKKFLDFILKYTKYFSKQKKIKNMQNIKKHKVVHIKIAKHLKENNVNKQNAKIHIKNGNKILWNPSLLKLPVEIIKNQI